jgi:two-component system phosphate regulon sensor histidine kinase PhoR
MKLGIRAKLFLLSLGLISVSLLTADIVLTSALDRLLTGRIRGDLQVRASLAEREASLRARSELRPDPAWETLAKDLGGRAQARLTFIGANGVVLGESEVNPPDVSAMENHRDRPEVRGALASGTGTSVRHSATLGLRMMYVATPFYRDGHVAGVVRLALPLSQVDEAVAGLRRLLLGASLVALAVAAIVSTLAAHRISTTLRGLARTAARMVGGDLGERARTHGHDEIATLGKSLDHLAENLSNTLDQLKVEHDLLGGILAGMEEGVLVVGRDGSVLHANPALREMLLLGSGVIGKHLLEVVRNVGLMDLLEEARHSEGTATGEVELGGIKPRRLLVQVSPLPGEPGELLVVLVDVTLLRRLELVRRDFVANASHELRTPVASLRSATETLRTAMGDPAASETFLEIIERNANRLQQLVDDLLDLSRIESRDFRLEAQPVALGTLVSAVAGVFQDAAGLKSMRLELDPGIQNHIVLADRRALEQVLSNLLDNAIKYSPEGSRVRVTAQATDGRVRVAVQDEGPGIPAQHLPRLFERFYRVDPGRSRQLGGTGLGLAIVKHLVEAMGGTVGVESEPGKGSEFSVTLPT